MATRLDYVLRADNVELRARSATIEQLEQAIHTHGRDAVIDRTAYTWFNRFCALRFMDANRYTSPAVVSPAPGATQPEILQEAKQGHIDERLPVDQQRVLDLLAGRVPSRDGQGEAYRLLLVAACNQWHKAMPFLFEPIDDYTELLLPDDLLSANSVLAATRRTLTDEVCEDVEVIGWLYEFYISEKKAEVDVKVKKGGKVEADELPAKTAMFTTHWIVRYLVENSLGRLWLLNHPRNNLADRMDYYIDLEHSEESFPTITSPEQLRVCDPACGSGHMLTYAFDLLYAIYEEEGYSPVDIPQLILTKNLVGLEIDPRSGALAAFALTMKARQRDRRFFSRGVAPVITVLEPLTFTEDEFTHESWYRETDESTRTALLNDLHFYADADNFGSLIRPQLSLEQIQALRRKATGSLFAHKLLPALDALEALTQQFHVIVANPPYLGKSMNAELKKFAKDNYPQTKSDLFAMFIERGFEFVVAGGFNAMITMESWMFLSSYEKMRQELTERATINSMVHMPYLGKGGTSLGINFGTAAAIFRDQSQPEFAGHFSCVRYYETDEQGVPFEFPVHNERLARAAAADFRKIPGSPIAYWVSDELRETFLNYPSVGSMVDTAQGMKTLDNERFIRNWQEVSIQRLAISQELLNGQSIIAKWFPVNHGGEYRKWFGNNESVINWGENGKEIKDLAVAKYRSVTRTVTGMGYYLSEGITWTAISTRRFSARWFPEGFLFTNAGMCAFGSDQDLRCSCCLLNSKVSLKLLEVLSPTINFGPNQIREMPYAVAEKSADILLQISDATLQTAQLDWDAYETSWGFSTLPLLRPEHRRDTLAATYAALRESWRAMTLDMQRLEEENNRIFIDAYGLQDELTPDVPLSEITLTCNPHYRYDSSKTDAELEALLLADTMREFISYAVGCLFGRYSLDKPGLVLANAGETVDDYHRQVPNPTFPPDADGVLPILDGDWFSDDIVGEFKRFLRVTFGEAHFSENLAFVEEALGRDIRSYFLREFYTHHVKTYKKRPIYWLFSSPMGSFNALIYLHRYEPDTVSVVLNNYLRDFVAKLTAEKTRLEQLSVSTSATAREKSTALREMGKLEQTLAELQAYEREILFPLAAERLAIDLDDGVKVNYNKFGRALKKVTGLTAK